jgi:hypothetical protein
MTEEILMQLTDRSPSVAYKTGQLTNIDDAVISRRIRTTEQTSPTGISWVDAR